MRGKAESAERKRIARFPVMGHDGTGLQSPILLLKSELLGKRRQQRFAQFCEQCATALRREA